MISMFDNVMVFNGPADPYAEAKAAFADGELQVRFDDEWYDVGGASCSEDFFSSFLPGDFRRRPKPNEPTTEPSVLQEHANLIAKLDEASDGWWGDFGYTPASDRNGIANEAMRHAMTQKPATPEPPKPKCSCPCHAPGSSVMHFRPCCSSDQPKPQAPDGVLEVAPMGRNPRGWGI